MSNATKSKLVSFYLGEAPDVQGRMFDDILTWNDKALEEVHDYIQWLFPLNGASAFNVLAPILTEEDILTLKSNKKARENVIRAFEKLLNFYGFEYAPQRDLFGLEHVLRTKDFEQKSQNWLTPGNHNFLRITRILKSLILLDRAWCALAFLRALESIYKERAGVTGEETLGYWRNACTLTILISHRPTRKSARCDCLWVSVDQRRLAANIRRHIECHRSRDHVHVACKERELS